MPNETPEITKRKVTMVNVTALGKDEDGEDRYARHEATDYVTPDFLDAYVADAQTRWQLVQVSDEPDAGPAGWHGQTAIPSTLTHPDAGTIRPATHPDAVGDGETELPAQPHGGGGDRGPRAFLTWERGSNFLGTQLLLGLWALSLAALIQTATQKNTLATSYGTAAAFGALYSTVPAGTAGTELTGGAPAYARRALSWGAAASGVITVTPTAFDVASGSTVAGAGVHTLISAGVYLDGSSVTSQSFASQGTYALTLTYTQT